MNFLNRYNDPYTILTIYWNLQQKFGNWNFCGNMEILGHYFMKYPLHCQNHIFLAKIKQKFAQKITVDAF